jgi:hypothetical protein
MGIGISIRIRIPERPKWPHKFYVLTSCKSYSEGLTLILELRKLSQRSEKTLCSFLIEEVTENGHKNMSLDPVMDPDPGFWDLGFKLSFNRKPGSGLIYNSDFPET